MTFLEITLGIICIILFLACIVLAKKLYELGMIILQVQDTLEESLDVIDVRSESMEKILSIPLFSDSPEIKSIQRDMIACKDAMLGIAYALSSSINAEENSEDLQP